MKPLIGSALAATALLAASACSGGAREGSLPATSPGGPSHRTTHARLLIKVPPQKHHKKIRVRGHYISPATASLTYTVTPALVGGATSGEVDINTSNPNCTVTGVVGYLSCSIDISGIVPATPYTFSFTTYDAAGGGGNILSANDDVPFTATPGAANVLSATLGGVASYLAITPITPYRITGSSTALTIYGNRAAKFALTPMDAQDNAIIGPGAPLPVASLAPGASATVAAVGTSSPNEWALTSTYEPSNPTIASTTRLTVSATPVPGSGGNAVSASLPVKLYQPWLYVTDDVADTITAYDEDGNVKSTPGGFPGLTFPYGVAYDPDNGWLYVVDIGASTMTAFDTAGNAMAGPWASATEATSITYDSNNHYFYVVGFSGVGAAYDAQGNPQSTPGGFPGLNAPLARWRSTRKRIGSTPSSANGGVAVYDETGASVSPSGGFLNYPPGRTSGVGYDPLHGWMWVSNASGLLAAYDGNGNSEVSSMQLANINGAQTLAFDPYDGLIYIANRYGGNVTAYDQQGNQYVLPAPMTGFSDPIGVFLVK